MASINHRELRSRPDLRDVFRPAVFPPKPRVDKPMISQAEAMSLDKLAERAFLRGDFDLGRDEGSAIFIVDPSKVEDGPGKILIIARADVRPTESCPCDACRHARMELKRLGRERAAQAREAPASTRSGAVRRTAALERNAPAPQPDKVATAKRLEREFRQLSALCMLDALIADLEKHGDPERKLDALKKQLASNGCCGCAACVVDRDVRCRAARNAAIKAWQAVQAPMRTRVVNNCDCPGCTPGVGSRRAAGGGRVTTPIERALRFAGLNTPDEKRLGSAQWSRA